MTGNDSRLHKFIPELEIIFDSIPAYFFCKDSNGRYLKVNKAFIDAVGFPMEEVIGKTFNDLFPDFIDQYNVSDHDIITYRKPKLDIIEPLITKTGMKWCRTNKIPYFDDKGEVIGLIGLAIDITDMVKSKDVLNVNEARYEKLMRSIPDIIYSLDGKGRFVDINHESLTSQLLGYSREDLIGEPFLDFVDDEDKEKVTTIFKTLTTSHRPYSGESQFRFKAKAGFVLWFENLSQYTYDENGALIREDGVLRDITSKKVIETELTTYATMDILTDVYNRRVGIAMLEKNLQIAKRSGSRLIITFLDVNGLKQVNDTFGHNEGDNLIRSVAGVLKSCARNSDIIARIGGDEFLYILPECSVDGERSLWERVAAEFEKINASGLNKYEISVSKGCAEFDSTHPKNADELIALADRRMYEEKVIYKKEKGLCR
jgi:diguanylate cyclase (GGDEF)-like protein/PAS domain S-box-containing protein